MPTVECPVEGCEYWNANVNPKMVAALTTTHVMTHFIPQSAPQLAKAEKVKHPCISSSGMIEDW